MTYMWCFQQQQ